MITCCTCTSTRSDLCYINITLRLTGTLACGMAQHIDVDGYWDTLPVIIITLGQGDKTSVRSSKSVKVDFEDMNRTVCM